MEDQYKDELEQAFNEFMSKVNDARSNYHQKIDSILKRADDLKIEKAKKNLNI